jgi:uncharacterized membrane protein YfcA
VDFATLGITVSPLALAGIGFLAGTLAALFGIGGGILVTPFLNILGVPMTVAVPTSITVVALPAVVATLRNRKWGNLNPRTGVITALFMLPTVEVSTRVMRHIKQFDPALVDTAIRAGYVAFIVVTAVAILRKKDGSAPGWLGRLRIPPMVRLTETSRFSLVVLGIGGVFAGILSGMMGLGGGQVLVPLFLVALSLGTKVAIGTSSFVILISALYGAASYGAKGMVDYPAAAFLAAGSVLGALVGSTALHAFSAPTVKYLFVSLTFAALVALVLKQCDCDVAALVVLVGTSVALAVAALAVVRLKRRGRAPPPQPGAPAPLR